MKENQEKSAKGRESGESLQPTPQTAGATGQQSQQLHPARSEQKTRPQGLMARDPFWPQWMENPWTMMQRLSEEMDRMFESFGMGRGSLSSRFARSQDTGRSSMWSPQLEVCERDNQLVVCADLPGMKKDDIQIEITDDMLTIQGERHQEFEDTGEGYRRSERSYGSFYRSIPLPEGVDGEKAQASFEDGVLKITMPLPPQQKPHGRRIEVQTKSTQPSEGQSKAASSAQSGA